MSLLNEIQINLAWDKGGEVFIASSENNYALPDCKGATRSSALKAFEEMLAQKERKGDGIAVFRFGIGNAQSVYVRQGTTVGDLILDTDLAGKLGFDPFSVRVLLNQKPLALGNVIVPDVLIEIETVGTQKSGFAPPKRHKCERWMRDNGCAPLPTRRNDDHEDWNVNGDRVQVNYRNGEMDLASLKAIARALKAKPFDVLCGMRAA